MKRLSPFLLFTILLGIAGCKTNQFNPEGKRHGRWVFTDTLGTHIYKYGGRFRNGIERGTWKYYFDDKLSRKEKYRKDISHNTFFYPNGKIMSQGKAQLDVSETEIHWYYFGDWQYFDENGKLTVVKTYEKGKEVKFHKVEE